MLDIPPETGFRWTTAVIYNYECDTIGGPYDPPFQGLAMDSQLPYTVDLTYLPTNDASGNIGFAYGGYYFEGQFACSGDTGLMKCQHAFPC